MRTSSVIGYLIASVFLVMAYQNCSATHTSDSSLSSFDACNLVLKEEFATGYHEFLKKNCDSCHVNNGSGNGAFADSDLQVAFDSFVVRGYKLVENRALDPNHQPPYTGDQHLSKVDTLDQNWIPMQSQAQICLLNAGVTVDIGVDEGIVGDDEQPTTHTIETFVKLTDPNSLDNGGQGTILTWDLGSEIKSPSGLSFPNAQLRVTVQAMTTVTGEKSYIISNPRLTAGDDSLHFQYLAIKINNQEVLEGTSFHQINRRVASGDTRDLATSAFPFNYDIRSTDVISILIGNLEAIPFNPPTFAELIAPGTGIFATNCMTCHDGSSGNPAGGFDISSRAAVISQLMVSPYSPNSSEIFLRLNDTQNPMPQGGPMLPDADIEQVLWWIQDGAL